MRQVGWKIEVGRLVVISFLANEVIDTNADAVLVSVVDGAVTKRLNWAERTVDTLGRLRNVTQILLLVAVVLILVDMMVVDVASVKVLLLLMIANIIVIETILASEVSFGYSMIAMRVLEVANILVLFVTAVALLLFIGQFVALGGEFGDVLDIVNVQLDSERNNLLLILKMHVQRMLLVGIAVRVRMLVSNAWVLVSV